ncbi:hypothetical protein EV360DRAFT_77056, partial [Lentinula raphanica]
MVDQWEETVNTVWPSATTNNSAAAGAMEDGYESSLQVPTSVLDACEQSFTAADGSREKASTQLFDSTALMAMLCCHDRVLWIVNMTSPGERQHYTFALIDQLFKNIPPTFKIGVLYDYQYFMHMDMAGRANVSTIHHHTRLYTLDSQVQHADREIGSHESGGTLKQSITKLSPDDEVTNSGQDVLFLCEQWKTQVTVQTKPLPKQSKNAGKTAIEEAIRLQKIRDTLWDRVSALEDIVTDVDSEVYEVAEAEEKLPDLRLKLSSVQTRLLHQEQTLGVAGQLCLRKRLIARKFERDRIGRSFRCQQYNDRKVRTHTEDAVKQQDPGIQALARRYNALCNQMKDLVNKRKAPRNAIALQPIPVKELFNLNMWTVGLDDAADCENPPAWLMDEDVRSGIKAILLRDRCEEELKRLEEECLALCSWSSEEWQVITICIEVATHP